MSHTLANANKEERKSNNQLADELKDKKRSDVMKLEIDTKDEEEEDAKKQAEEAAR